MTNCKAQLTPEKSNGSMIQKETVVNLSLPNTIGLNTNQLVSLALEENTIGFSTPMTSSESSYLTLAGTIGQPKMVYSGTESHITSSNSSKMEPLELVACMDQEQSYATLYSQN